MKKFWLNLLLVFLVSAFVFGCQAHKAGVVNPAFQAQDLNAALQSGDFKQKVDNFFVVLDSSGSADETYRGYSKFAITNDFLRRMNMAIPDMDLTAGMRSFGATRNPFAQKTRLIYGPTTYTKEGFQSALDTVKWGGGESPAEMAIDASSDDMYSFKGQTAFIFVGDGQYAGNDPAAAVKRLKDRYGDKMCVYTVLVGSEEPASVDTMRAMADAGECGFYQSVKYIESPQAMADWVEDVFLVEVVKPPPPLPLPVGDSDGDGVTDDVDQCQDTPVGASVNDKGCWIIDNVEFDFDKFNIKSEFVPILVEIADVMNKNAGIILRINGHTDIIGTEDYNMELGEKRAMAAKKFLIDQGIGGGRITTESFGYSRPVATNSTEWGRARNRRDEFKWNR
ncbi:MAG: OmpA family protein [Desulfobacterales bacterium]|nr:MAG: OmpA family protein [Desulfobacterales bacterium]